MATVVELDRFVDLSVSGTKKALPRRKMRPPRPNKVPSLWDGSESSGEEVEVVAAPKPTRRSSSSEVEVLAAPKPTRRGGEKEFSKAAVPKPSRRGRQKGSPKAGPQEEAVIMPGRRGRQKGSPKASSQEKGAVILEGKREKAATKKGGASEVDHSAACGGHGKCKEGPPQEKNMMSEEEVRYILSWEKREPYNPKKDRAAGFFNQLNGELFEYQQEIRDEYEEKGYVEIPDNFEEDNKRINHEAHRRAYRKVFGTEPPAKLYSV